MGIVSTLAKQVLKQTKKGAKPAVVKRPGQVALETETKKVAEGTLEPKNIPEVKKVVSAVDDDIEAGFISELDFEKFKLDETFQTNFDTIHTTDGIKAVIADVAKKNAIQIDEARRGKITNEQLQGLANDLDIREDVVRKVMERESGGVMNAETILAARQVLVSSADRIHSLAVKITKAEATDLDRLKFRRQLQWHREYQTGFMGARAESGRALNAYRIPTSGDEIDIRRVMELVDSAAGHDTNQVAKAIALMDNTASISNLARKYTQSKFMGVLNELFVNSILSGPKTHVINTTGNIMMQSMSITETAVAARIGRFLGGDEHVLIGEASAMFHGTNGAYRDAFRLLGKTMRTGIPLDDVVKFEGLRRRSISAEHLLTAEQRATPLGRVAEIILDGSKVSIKGKEVPVPGIGQIIRAPTERVMMPVDEFFKTLAYRSEIERQAFLHVNDQIASGAAKMDQAADIAREFMENTPLKAIKAAEDYARYVTFQNALGPRAQAFQLAIAKTPVLKLLAPFVRTPVNIFKAGILERSPIGLLTPKFWNAMKKGGRDRDMMLARVGMGTATSSVVASYAIDGTITGAGPRNPDARRLLEMSGWQPYSVLVGDTYHSYARLEPLAFVIGAVADTVEISSYINSDVEGMDDEQQQLNNAVAAIIMGITNNTMSKTYVRGIADFMEMATNPERKFAGWAKSMSSALVPFSALRSQLGAIDDPYLREAWTIIDNLKIRSGIPGWSEGAPPRRDLFGKPRPVKAGSLLGPMSPMPERDINEDATINQLVSLMNLTRTVPVTMPSKRVNGMRLTVQEYDQLILISRTEPSPATGLTFTEELDRTFSEAKFLGATPDMQVDMIKHVQATYDANARDLLEENNPLFAERLKLHGMKRDRLKFGD